MGIFLKKPRWLKTNKVSGNHMLLSGYPPYSAVGIHDVVIKVSDSEEDVFQEKKKSSFHSHSIVPGGLLV